MFVLFRNPSKTVVVGVQTQDECNLQRENSEYAGGSTSVRPYPERKETQSAGFSTRAFSFLISPFRVDCSASDFELEGWMVPGSGRVVVVFEFWLRAWFSIAAECLSIVFS
jgi:hypothetical protein